MKFWQQKTGCKTLSEMKIEGENEIKNWKETAYALQKSENGWNYYLLMESDWLIVNECETPAGKVVKFCQSIKNAGKQNKTQGKNMLTSRFRDHNDICYMRIGDHGIDRYLAMERAKGFLNYF